MKKKVISLILSFLLIAGIASGCGSSPAQDASGSTGTPSAAPSNTPAPAGGINLVMWHSMGGSGGEAIEKMVSDFNASQKQIKVSAEFQGSYDDAITKLKSSAASGSGPDIMQLYDIGTKWMIDSGNAVVMQELIDKDGYDLKQIEPNIAGYYTVDGKLHSMPFNSSTPIMYYNKNAFKAAGLDPEKPPENWDELEQYASALTKKEGGETLNGATIQIYGWFFEQYMSKQGKTFANNGNGRDSNATAVEFDSNGGGVNFLKRWNDLVKKGVMGNMGRDGTAITQSFAAGKTFIIFGSTASLSSILSAVGNSFELGTGFLPDLDKGVNGGVSIGGASLWIMNHGDDNSKMASWDFVKFMVAPEQQVYWNKQTGYFPVTTAAYELEEMQQHLKEKPQFQTAIDQLHASPVGARGALLGVFTEARATVEANIEEMLSGALTPEQAVAKSAESINSSIEKYNVANN